MLLNRAGGKNILQKTKPTTKETNKDGSSNKPLATYINRISKTKPLTRNEEYCLSLKIKEGDVNALNELVRENIQYNVALANKYSGYGMSLQVLIEEGNIGLILGVKSFNSDKHAKLFTYAD